MSLDRKDLKIQALLEKIATLTQSYENQVADLRVAITVSEQSLKESQDEIKRLTEPVNTEDPDVSAPEPTEVPD